MTIQEQILLFIIGFSCGFCLLLSCKALAIIENISRTNEYKTKKCGWSGLVPFFAMPIFYFIALAVFKTLHSVLWLYTRSITNPTDLSKLRDYIYEFLEGYGFYQALINLCLGSLLSLPVLIHLRLAYMLGYNAVKNQLILIGANGFFIIVIIISEAYILGVFNAIQTPWMSVELSPNYNAKMKPSIYEAKRELNGFIEPLLKKLDIGCAMLGDRVFDDLTNTNKDALNKSKLTRNNSDEVVYPLLLLIQRVLYVQELGEPRHRLADILAPVKRSLKILLDNTNLPNGTAIASTAIKSSAVKDLRKSIIAVFNELDRLISANGKEKITGALVMPYDNKSDSGVDHSGWCDDLKLYNKDKTAYTHDPSKINKIDEIAFNYAASMPYIYELTAVYMLYDSDIDGAIDLLNKVIGIYTKKTDSHKLVDIDMNVYYLVSQLAYLDARPVEYYMKYDEEFLGMANNKLKILKSKSGDFKDALVKRYEKAVSMVQNNISYGLIRQQSRLTDGDFALARKYADEAYGYANNQKDPVYIDTLGYVRLVTVLRNGGLSSEQKKHEIESARILLERAYSIAKAEYKAIVEKDEVDAIEESEARLDLMIYEDHLNEALRYEAEINRIE